MCFIRLTDIVFDVYGMNPLNIKILLTNDFNFNGFLRYCGGAFYGIMRTGISFDPGLRVLTFVYLKRLVFDSQKYLSKCQFDA